MNRFSLPALILVFIFSIFAALTFGAANLSIEQLADCLIEQCDSQINNVIFWQIRLPRVLVGFVAGAGLACAGAILQNVTRNPLADPYLFGIVAGAGLGATIASLLFTNQLAIALPLAAFLGALFSVLLVFLLAKVMQRSEQLLLAGVAISFMLGAVSQFILYTAEPLAANRVLFWLMGSLARVEIQHFYLISAVLFLAIIIIVAYHRHIDALALGDETAITLGINVTTLRLVLLAVCAALTATIVAYCGGISFIGLLIPHIVRHFVGNKTVSLIIGSSLLGGCFLIWVDVIARSAMPTIELPIGIITSIVGSIFFLFIMYQGNRHG
jgi:iron complex transport system permease protein